jgi:hypothetical protein
MGARENRDFGWPGDLFSITLVSGVRPLTVDDVAH